MHMQAHAHARARLTSSNARLTRPVVDTGARGLLVLPRCSANSDGERGASTPAPLLRSSIWERRGDTTRLDAVESRLSPAPGAGEAASACRSAGTVAACAGDDGRRGCVVGFGPKVREVDAPAPGLAGGLLARRKGEVAQDGR